MENVLTELLERTVQLLGDPNLSQEQAADVLVSSGTDEMIVSRLVAFLPEAFGIVLVSHLKENNTFPASFLARDKRGNSESIPFSSEPIFVQALQRAQAMYHDGPRHIFSAVSLRSSILKLINEALEKKLTFDGSKIAIAFGIPAELYRKPKPSFWRKLLGSK